MAVIKNRKEVLPEKKRHKRAENRKAEAETRHDQSRLEGKWSLGGQINLKKKLGSHRLVRDGLRCRVDTR